MNKTLEEVTTLLVADLKREAVKSRSQGGAALSYVDTYYVIKRLNECFGNLGWDSETVDMVLLTQPGEKAAYRAKVRITAIVATGDGGYMKVCKEGTGWGSDKSTNNAHEIACKEAESDALKRAAMKFGMSLGLALYDKSQENVEDAPKSVVTPASIAAGKKLDAMVAQATKPCPTPTDGPVVNGYITTAKGYAKGTTTHATNLPPGPLLGIKDAAPTQTVSPKFPVEQSHPTPASDREAVNKRITAMSNVILAIAGPSGAPERAAKAAELKALVASKGAETKEALTDAKAAKLLKTLEEMVNG